MDRGGRILSKAWANILEEIAAVSNKTSIQLVEAHETIYSFFLLAIKEFSPIISKIKLGFWIIIVAIIANLFISIFRPYLWIVNTLNNRCKKKTSSAIRIPQV